MLIASNLISVQPTTALQAVDRPYKTRYSYSNQHVFSWRKPLPNAGIRLHAHSSAAAVNSAAATAAPLKPTWGPNDDINMVMKFGGSSVATAERMEEVAAIILSFPGQFPVVVLSAMGKTTNLLLQAGEEALTTAPGSISSLSPLRKIKELHRETADKLGIDAAAKEEVEALLTQLAQLLVGVSIMQDLTPRARDSLVSFGERLSTRLFAAYLRAHGVPARQYDAFSIGITTNDDFTNADVIYDATLPAVKKALTRGPGQPAELPVVTGFLGKGAGTGAITTLGRGGSDLTCTLIGAALGLPEVQVWKDVDGILTSDPRVVDGALPVDELTFEEATELAFFGATVLHPLAMLPAIESSGSMGVRVKNSYNRTAPGTLITATRDMSKTMVTSIVLKQNTTLIDIISTRMLGQYGFLAKVFKVFDQQKLSVDVVATSEVSVSLTLDPAKTLWERDLIDEELDALMDAFSGWSTASYRRGMSILSLICSKEKTNFILARVFAVLGAEMVQVELISQGASKVNISLVVADAKAKGALRALHKEFFEQ
jgi:aspartate kinase